MEWSTSSNLPAGRQGTLSGQCPRYPGSHATRRPAPCQKCPKGHFLNARLSHGKPPPILGTGFATCQRFGALLPRIRDAEILRHRHCALWNIMVSSVSDAHAGHTQHLEYSGRSRITIKVSFFKKLRVSLKRASPNAHSFQAESRYSQF